jgi:hypothetical protein
MVMLYRASGSPRADAVEERLRELVVAHRIVHVRPDEAAHPLPYLTSGEVVYATEARIAALLDELAEEVRISRLYQSDACYLDPEAGDGRTCL